MKRTLKAILLLAALLLAAPAFAQLNVPEIAYDSTPDFLNTGDMPILGEAVGVATNSQGTCLRIHAHGLDQCDDGNEPRVRTRRLAAVRV